SAVGWMRRSAKATVQGIKAVELPSLDMTAAVSNRALTGRDPTGRGGSFKTRRRSHRLYPAITDLSTGSNGMSCGYHPEMPASAGLLPLYCK
ncbi:MAG: hypothetical protein WBO18_04705, partial [Gammaproteobacteria bacterium]